MAAKQEKEKVAALPDKFIGAGGNGHVIRHTDPNLGVIAVKLFVHEGARTFEYERLSSVQRPGHQCKQIIKLLGTCEIKRPNPREDPSIPTHLFGLKLEFIPFGCINQFIDNWHPVIDVEVLSHWLFDAANALQFLSNANIIHFDVKPQNLLVRADFSLVLTDFSNALPLKDVSTITAIRGSPEYSSPEVLANKGISCVADVFSLGIVIYELASGRNPLVSIKDDWALSIPDRATVILARINTWVASAALH